MSHAAGRPPLLTHKAVSTLVKRYFNFTKVSEHTIKTFPSYSDRNYYFQGENPSERDCEFILKIINSTTSYQAIDGIVNVMKHLNSQNLPCPGSLDSRTGENSIQLLRTELLSEPCTSSADSDNTMKYPVYVLKFVPGKLFDDVEKEFLTPALLQEVGSLLGKMDKELLDNFPCESFVSGVSQDWDLMQFPQIRHHLHEIKDSSNKLNAEKVIKAYEDHVIPKIPLLRKGIIHYDMNGKNIILQGHPPDGYKVSGFIDFNDCSNTCIIFELGISLAHMMIGNLHPVTCSSVIEFVGPLIGAYTSVMPLKKEELACLYHVVLARCVLLAINSARDFETEPWNTYLLSYINKSWMFVEYLLSTSMKEVYRIWNLKT